MEKYTFTEIVRVAVRKEQESVRFYRRMAERASLSGQRQMFLELADEEARHEDLLEHLDLNAIADESPEEIPNLHLSEYLTEPPISENLYYDEILRLAMKREEKSVHLYQHMLPRAPDDRARELLQFLVSQELLHKYRLEREYDDNVLREM